MKSMRLHIAVNGSKYHAREVAIERSKLMNASVVLGSATPSLESYHLAKEEYRYSQLPRRIGDRRYPLCMWWMREELKSGNRTCSADFAD